MGLLIAILILVTTALIIILIKIIPDSAVSAKMGEIERIDDQVKEIRKFKKKHKKDNSKEVSNFIKGKK